MWSETHIWTNLRFLFENDQKVPIFVEKLKKMQPPNITFRSQLEPSIKSYECFMFLQNIRWKSHWTDGFLKDLNRFFLSKTEICFVFAVQLGRRYPQSPNKIKKNKKTMTNICSSSKNETKRTLRSGHLVSFRVFN